MAADVSQGDPIRETIQGVCQKLQSTGDDCLFLRVTDKGTACCTLGTKNSLLFMRTQPQLAEEFRRFCSDLYSTVTVAVKEEGLDDADSYLTCDEGSSKEVDTKVSTATLEEPEGRSRPKRKMCTPSKLKLYETNFRKSNENGKTSKPIEKHVSSVKESNIETGRKKSLVEESEEKGSPRKKVKSMISSSVNKNSETPSTGKQKSEIPSNKKVENSASTKKMSETTRGKSRSKLDQSETVSLKDLTDEDDIDEYNDDDNDDDYVADNDYSPSARSASKKVSISKKEDMDSTTQSLKYKCERCSLDFRRRSTLNRHLKNKICSRVKRNGKKVELVKQSHTSLVSQKGLLDSQYDGTKPKKLKCTTDMKLEVAEDGGEEETEDISVVSIETNSEDVVKNNKVTDEVHIIKIKEEKEDSDEESWDTSRTTKTKQRVKVPTPCKSCNVVFSSKYTLRRHMMHGLCPGIKLDIKSTITGGQEVLSCDICPKTFLSSIAFLRHYQRHKLGPSSAFICNICKSEFCHDWERVNHLVRHHKVKGPIDCQVCKHSYQNYDDYRTHRRFCKTTLKCEGEATLKITTSGDKENIFVRNMQNNNSVSDEISDSDNRRHASSQGGIIQVNSDNHKQDVIERDSVRVKLSCGTVAFFKESMIKKSFVADKNGSTNTPKDNIPSDTINSSGEAPSSERIMESSEQTADLVQDEVKSTENISVESVNPTPDMDVPSIICTKCHKDVRGLYDKDDDGQHFCKICRRPYASASQLSRHMAIHTASELYRCHLCGKCFVETRYLQRHLVDTHHERYNVCRFCCGLFTEQRSLTEHLKEKHPDQGGIMCKVCDKECPDGVTCTEHENKHYRAKSRKYVCDLCGKMLNSKHSLSMHVAWHKDLRPWTCDICNKSFRTRMNLLGHMPVHSGVKSHQCEICGQCFKLKETLRRHKRIHVKESRYQCNKCGQKFRSTDGLNNHMVSIHLTAHDISSLKFKVRQCDICGKLCGSKQMYERHIVTHTDQRPFPCQFCHRSYYNSSVLNRHIRTVHNKEGVHTCLLCKCEVSSRSKWGRHLRTRKHRDKCMEMDIDEETIVEGTHYIVNRGGEDHSEFNHTTVKSEGNGKKKRDRASKIEYSDIAVKQAGQTVHVDYLQEMPVEETIGDTEFIQQITEEVHDAGFIHQITGEVQNSSLIQEISDVVQSGSSTLSSEYISQIPQGTEPREQSTIMEIVYDQPECMTAVDSIVEGQPRQKVIYLKVIS